MACEWFEELWLSIAMLLYFIALAIVFLLQRPALNKIIALTEQPPGPEGPPAELRRRTCRNCRSTGVVLLVLTLAIAGPDGLEAGLRGLGLSARGRPSSSSSADRRE